MLNCSNFIFALVFLCLLIDCWHSVPLLPVQTHCSNDALWEHGHHRVSCVGAWQDQPNGLQVNNTQHDHICYIVYVYFVVCLSNFHNPQRVDGRVKSHHKRSSRKKTWSKCWSFKSLKPFCHCSMLKRQFTESRCTNLHSAEHETTQASWHPQGPAGPDIWAAGWCWCHQSDVCNKKHEIHINKICMCIPGL